MEGPERLKAKGARERKKAVGEAPSTNRTLSCATLPGGMHGLVHQEPESPENMT